MMFHHNHNYLCIVINNKLSACQDASEEARSISNDHNDSRYPAWRGRGEAWRERFTRLPCLYPGEEINDVMRLDDIRLHKDWTTFSNFRRQIEILEISEEWEEDLKTEHDFRMDRLLRRHFRYHLLAFSRHLLDRSGNDVHSTS
jgi:hypothetical protein